jgi:hypothetical protein
MKRGLAVPKADRHLEELLAEYGNCIVTVSPFFSPSGSRVGSLGQGHDPSSSDLTLTDAVKVSKGPCEYSIFGETNWRPKGGFLMGLGLGA